MLQRVIINKLKVLSQFNPTQLSKNIFENDCRKCFNINNLFFYLRYLSWTLKIH